MTTQVATTQLIVDASGAKQGVAEFEAAMARAKEAAVKGGEATASSFESAQRRWVSSLGATDPVIKAQIKMESDLARQRKINDDAVKLGIATQAAADAQLEKVRKNHVAAIRELEGHGRASQELASRATAMAGSLGTAGSALIALGPAGIAAGAALGIVTLGVNSMVTAANELANTGGKLVDFAETTGLTTSQLQALQKTGAQVGVEAEKIGAGFERFSVSLDELRRGSGSLHEGLNRINPTLSTQLALARSTGEAWDILAKAIAGATTQEQRNALARAAFGRSGVPMTRLASETVAGGGLGILESANALDAISQAQLRRWDEIKDRIDIATSAGKKNFTSIFAEDVLQLQERAATNLLTLSRIAKEFSISSDLRTLIAGPAATGELPGVFEPFGWLKTLIDFLPLLRQIQTAGLAAVPQITVSPSGGGYRVPAADQALRDQVAQSDTSETLERRTSILAKQVAAMGEAADSADRLRLSEQQLTIAAREAGLSQEQYNAALAALRSAAALSDMREWLSIMGDSATVTDLMRQRIEQLNRAYELGKISADDYFHRMGDLQRNESLQRERDRLGALGDAATEMDRYRLRVAELQKQLDQGRISQDTFNQAVLNSHPILREVREIGISFTSDFVRGLMSGKSAMESLGNAATSLSNKLADKAITSLFTGDFMGAAVSGIGAVVSGLFGNAQKKKQEQAAMWQEVMDINQRAALIGVDTATRSGSIAAMEAKQQSERMQAAQKGWAVYIATDNLHRQELAALNADWDKREAEIAKQKREDELRAAEELAKAIAERHQNFIDRAFKAGLDTTSMDGALAAFDRDALREREQEIAQGGQAIASLEYALAMERLAIIQDFGRKATEEARRAAEQQVAAMTRAARQITDYLLGLRTGAESPLPPSARLAAAQTAYNSTLGLAQGGNTDALDRITKDAEALRIAAQAMFGTGAGYQAVFNQIQTQLGSLSAIQNSADPVVMALNQIATRQEQVYFDTIATSADASTTLENTTISVLRDIYTVLTTFPGYYTQIVSAAGKIAQNVTPATPAPDPALEKQKSDNRARYNKDVDDWNWAVTVPSDAGFWYDVAVGIINKGNPAARKHQYDPMRFGGIVPGYANGGMIGNGIWDRDSVLARYAGGGHIALAGGEFVMPAPQTKRFYPELEAMRSGRAANDNGTLLAEIRSMHRTMGSLLTRIADLESRNVVATERGTEAVLIASVETARQTRLASRQKAA